MAPETGPSHDNATGDLAWLAFGYATGGLDAEQSASFERRLDADQSAREALAEAVLLSGSVALAAVAERRTARFRRLTVTAFALATAACLALAVSPRLFAPVPRVARIPPSAAAPAPAPAPIVAGNGAVALAWSGLRHEAEPAHAGGTGSDPDDLIDRLAAPADAPPHWLLEAAALPAPDEGRGS